MKPASRRTERPADGEGSDHGLELLPEPARGAGIAEAEGDPALRLPEDILQNPRFPAVRERQLRMTLQVYASSVFPGRLSVDAWRVLLIGHILGMACEDIDGGCTATPTELKRRMALHGLIGPRQIDVYLNRLVATGDLEIAVNPADRRMRLLRPLPPLVNWYWSFLDIYQASYSALFPERTFDLIPRREASFLPFMARVGVDDRCMANVMTALTRDPVLAAFSARGGASLLLDAALLLESQRSDQGLREADLLAYGIEFGRSRSHTRNLITLAIESGFIEESGRRRQLLRTTERLRTTMDHYIADTIRMSENTYRRAERQYLASRAAG